MWEWFKLKLEAWNAWILAALAFIAATERVRNRLGGCWVKIRHFATRGRRRDEAIQKLSETVEVISFSVQEIQKELQPNGGGSLKDKVESTALSVRYLLDINEQTFRNVLFPAFQCDEEGKNLIVSNSYLEFLGVSDVQELELLGWQGFIDKNDLERYARAFRVASESKSSFRSPARFISANGEQLGEWLVEGSRLSDGRYLGKFVPNDEKAEAIARKKKWV